jgi:hypothetical protein
MLKIGFRISPSCAMHESERCAAQLARAAVGRSGMRNFHVEGAAGAETGGEDGVLARS